jgi:hypothetical protein
VLEPDLVALLRQGRPLRPRRPAPQPGRRAVPR